MKHLFTILILLFSLILRSQAGSQWEPYNDNLFSIGNIKTPSGYLFKDAANQWEIVQADATNGPVSYAGLGSLSNQLAGSIISSTTVTNIASNQVAVATSGYGNIVTHNASEFQTASAALTTLAGGNGSALTMLTSAVQAGTFTATTGTTVYTITFAHAWPDTHYTVTGSPITSGYQMAFACQSKSAGSCTVFVNIVSGSTEIDWTAVHWTQ